MTDQNPYSTPDAALDTGQDALYQPSIFSFSGRIGRLRYVAYGLGINLLLIAVIAPVVGLTLGGGDLGALSMIIIGVFYLASITVSVMFGKRRLNDLNRSGWWMVLFIVPLANFFLGIYMLFFPGSQSANNFGPAPTANSIGILILGWSVPVLVILGLLSAIIIPMVSGPV